ncbi:unnamed protein product, partial [Amoebophrya sp. A120]
QLIAEKAEPCVSKNLAPGRTSSAAENKPRPPLPPCIAAPKPPPKVLVEPSFFQAGQEQSFDGTSGRAVVPTAPDGPQSCTSTQFSYYPSARTSSDHQLCVD